MFSISKAEINLILVVTGVLLLSLTLFRSEVFQTKDMLVHIFVALVVAGLLLIAFGFARLFGGKGVYGLVTLIALEAMLAIFFSSVGAMQVRRTPAKLKQFMSLVYNRGFMNSVQFDRSVSYFDPELQYLFKPGKHNFNNLEFNSVLNINSAGFRDDERSLDHPSVLFLGDSYTMGWGVKEDESYASLFEKQTNTSVLNAGISSYGTARERLLMDRLDLDSCKVLFIQYCSNDLAENYMFSRNEGQLAPERDLRDGYELYARMNILFKSYYPFKHVYWLLRGTLMYTGVADWLNSIQRSESDEGNDIGDNHDEYLYNVLVSIREKFHGEIVLFIMDAAYPEKLTQQLAKVAGSPELSIRWLDMSKIGLQANDYFLLDPHINASGHRKVANYLISFARETGILSSQN
jgi:TM2 domain-containing membrane protein YozV